MLVIAGGCGHRHAAWEMASDLAEREARGGDEVRVEYVYVAPSGMVEAELCVDLYDYGDLPGHPTVPCFRSITYLAMLAPDGWITRKLDPMVIECVFDEPADPDLPGQAEVGLSVPR